MSSYTTLFTRLSTQLMRGRALVRLLAHAHVRQLLRSVSFHSLAAHCTTRLLECTRARAAKLSKSTAVDSDPRFLGEICRIEDYMMCVALRGCRATFVSATAAPPSPTPSSLSLSISLSSLSLPPTLTPPFPLQLRLHDWDECHAHCRVQGRGGGPRVGAGALRKAL